MEFSLTSARDGTRRPYDPADGPRSDHRIVITTVDELLRHFLAISSLDELDVATWLTTSEQHFAEITARCIFHDRIGGTTRIREDLGWYPDAVWRYRMADEWTGISRLQPFTGRCGELGDDLENGDLHLAIGHWIGRGGT